MKPVKRNLIIIIVIAIITFISITFLSCKETENNTDKINAKTVWVNTTNPIVKNITVPVLASGILTTPDEVALSFKTAGIIEDIKVEEGQFVKKGQLLALLNTTEINAIYSQAKTGFEKAKRDYERTQKLYDDSVATKEQLQNIQSVLEASKASLEQALFNLQHSFIYAPSNGYVLHKMANVGEIIGAGHPIIFLGNTNGFEWSVKVGVSDKEMLKLSLLDTTYITIDAYPEVQFKGRIKEIGTFPNRETGVYPVEIRFNSSKYKLAYGFSAKVKIIPSSSSIMTLLPLEAFVDMEEMQATVWIIDKSNKPSKNIVNIDLILGNMAAIKKCDELLIKPEDLIVTNGQNQLSENSIIKIKN